MSKGITSIAEVGSELTMRVRQVLDFSPASAFPAAGLNRPAPAGSFLLASVLNSSVHLQRVLEKECFSPPPLLVLSTWCFACICIYILLVFLVPLEAK